MYKLLSEVPLSQSTACAYHEWISGQGVNAILYNVNCLVVPAREQDAFTVQICVGDHCNDNLRLAGSWRSSNGSQRRGHCHSDSLTLFLVKGNCLNGSLLLFYIVSVRCSNAQNVP